MIGITRTGMPVRSEIDGGAGDDLLIGGEGPDLVLDRPSDSSLARAGGQLSGLDRSDFLL
ncbi:hypothetical protein [Tabrizicola sp. M-4]|uniref:hypothetical protein n=1 Tax=Tabrizicola sp. M-4 TaxID=3055847 RepID=UPI003DA7C789